MEQFASTVWMVHEGTGLGGVKGDLTLEETAISFRPQGSGAPITVFPLSEVRRVRRVLGSPVLELRLRRGEVPPVVGFYFVEPPVVPSTAGGPLERRSARRVAIAHLVRSNASKKKEIGRWVQAIRRGESGGRAAG